MKRIFAVLFMLMFLFIPSAFAAQPDISSDNISLTDKPTGIHFDCDSVEVKGNERTAYVNGNMVFTQDNLRITADNGSFNWKTKNAVFSGNVTVNGTPHTGDLTYNVRDKKFL